MELTSPLLDLIISIHLQIALIEIGKWQSLALWHQIYKVPSIRWGIPDLLRPALTDSLLKFSSPYMTRPKPGCNS